MLYPPLITAYNNNTIDKNNIISLIVPLPILLVIILFDINNCRLRHYRVKSAKYVAITHGILQTGSLCVLHVLYEFICAWLNVLFMFISNIYNDNFPQLFLQDL